MTKHQNITEDAFRFLKYRCLCCRKILPRNKLFCNKECRDLYFERIKNVKIKTWINKSKRRTGVSDILNEENLKVMVKNIENKIDERMDN